MYDNRSNRRLYRNAIGGVVAGLFVLCLAVAIYLGAFSGNWFLPILFVALAFAALVGSLTASDRKVAYGGLYGVVWFLGLALCFWIGFWPWILLPVGFSIILGALAAPILSGVRNVSYPPASQQYPSPYQPYQPYQAGQPSPPYQQGQPYQPPQQAEQGNQPPQQEAGPQQEVEQQHQPVEQP